MVPAVPPGEREEVEVAEGWKLQQSCRQTGSDPAIATRCPRNKYLEAAPFPCTPTDVNSTLLISSIKTICAIFPIALSYTSTKHKSTSQPSTTPFAHHAFFSRPAQGHRHHRCLRQCKASFSKRSSPSTLHDIKFLTHFITG